MRRKGLAFIGGLLLVALGLAGCSGGTAGTSAAKGNGVLAVVPAEKRKEPVDLVGTTLTGARLDLATLRGKPVVLNVWGSWCAPCRTEAPELQAASTELAEKVAFVGIDTVDHKAEALAYERRFKITYPSFFDEGDLLLALRGAVASQAPPVTLILDAKGRIAARFLGPITRRTLVDAVADVTKSA